MTIIAILLAWLYSAGTEATQPSAGGIPFAFERNQIILMVSVNGHDSLNFLLDTGTDNSTIDEATAQRIGLKVVPSESFKGGVPSTVWLRNLKIGSLAVDSLFAWAPDLSRVSKSLGRPLHGVLGYSFLQDRIVQIDYPNRVVRFLDNPPPIEKIGRNVMLPMLFLTGRNIPLFEKLYVREKPIRATLDTGSSMGLMLYPRATADLGMEEEARHAPRATALVYNGDEEVRKGPKVQVRLQAAQFDSVQVYFAVKSAEYHLLPERDGNLGNECFKNTRLTLDYKNKQIDIER